jgi:hypothetical protein
MLLENQSAGIRGHFAYLKGRFKVSELPSISTIEQSVESQKARSSWLAPADLRDVEAQPSSGIFIRRIRPSAALRWRDLAQ